jgi:hypothetical protein
MSVNWIELTSALDAIRLHVEKVIELSASIVDDHVHGR